MIYLKNNSKGYSALELVVSFWIVLTLIGIFGIYASRVVVAAREVALRNELYNLRLSLELYKVFNKSNPKEIGDLYNSVKDYFVMINRFDKAGKLLDPFGNEYYYNPKTGRIRSATERYINW